MSDKYIMLDLNDERSGKIAEAMANKTCKKILGLLAEREMSESEISSELRLPINTVDYNIKNLMQAGLIKETGKFLWSVKGKRVLKYRVSNRKIVISPKSMAKGILPAVLITGAIAFFVKVFTGTQSVVRDYGAGQESAKAMVSGASGVSSLVTPTSAQNAITQAAGSSNVWAWFLLGGLTALLIYVILRIIDERRFKNG